MTRVARQTGTPADTIDERRTEIHYWWLLVAIFFEYARPGVFLSGIEAAKLNSLIPLSLLALVLVVGGLRPFGQIFADRQVRWLVFYQGLLLVQVLVADVQLNAWNVFKNTLGYFLLFLIIARVATSMRRLRGIFATLAASHLFLIWMNPDIVTKPEQRTGIAGGTFLGDGNDFSLSLCILIPMLAALAIGARSKISRLLWWAGVGVCLLAIVGTQSRGGTLGIFAVAVFVWLFSKRKVASLVVMVLLSSVALFHASDEYFGRMSTITNYENEGSAQGRIMVWKAASRMALDHPLFGVGTGQFPVMFGAQYKPKDYVGPYLTAHSIYFLVLGELGVPGLVTLIGIVVIGVVTTMKVRRRLLESGTDPPSRETEGLSALLFMLSASMIGFAVAGAFLSAAYYPHVFVLTGLLCSARCIALVELDRRTLVPCADPLLNARQRRRSAVAGRESLRAARGSGT